jgi:hypothetical protein
MLRRLARLKYRMMRLSGYITILNTVILIFGFGWKWWYLPCLALVILAYLFEQRHGIAGEMDVAWKNSAEWQKFRGEWDAFTKNL